MKVFKILKQIFQICATALFLASLIICSIDNGAENTAYMTALAAFIGLFPLATVGMFLISSKSDTPCKVGHGLVLSSFASGLTVAIMSINTASAAILMIAAAIMLALYYLCILILKIMQRTSPNAESPSDDIRIVHVKEWKKVMEEGIISPEEYEAKRCQILGIEPKKDAAPAPTDTNV